MTNLWNKFDKFIKQVWKIYQTSLTNKFDKFIKQVCPIYQTSLTNLSSKFEKRYQIKFDKFSKKKWNIIVNFLVLNVRHSFNSVFVYMITFSVAFKKSGNLFEILGSTYERLFCPWLVFHDDWVNLNKEVLVAVVFWPAGLNTSLIYKGLKLLKYVKVIEIIHFLNRSFMGSQFIFSNLVKHIWALLFKFRQKWMHLLVVMYMSLLGEF